ncbi:hypothetical protein RRG08_045136 [Elysia crispata]|uniref:Uncharacterized protein n=1 Tax=Elysia crispata TaxID=231223 RepID=A0AAE0YTG2_9GAST|nr:hypothetical protein RRG08_045136 [Elysia crispata]
MTILPQKSGIEPTRTARKTLPQYVWSCPKTHQFLYYVRLIVETSDETRPLSHLVHRSQVTRNQFLARVRRYARAFGGGSRDGHRKRSEFKLNPLVEGSRGVKPAVGVTHNLREQLPRFRGVKPAVGVTHNLREQLPRFRGVKPAVGVTHNLREQLPRFRGIKPAVGVTHNLREQLPRFRGVNYVVGETRSQSAESIIEEMRKLSERWKHGDTCQLSSGERVQVLYMPRYWSDVPIYCQD